MTSASGSADVPSGAPSAEETGDTGAPGSPGSASSWSPHRGLLAAVVVAAALLGLAAPGVAQEDPALVVEHPTYLVEGLDVVSLSLVLPGGSPGPVYVWFNTAEPDARDVLECDAVTGGWHCPLPADARLRTARSIEQLYVATPTQAAVLDTVVESPGAAPAGPTVREVSLPAAVADRSAADRSGADLPFVDLPRTGLPLAALLLLAAALTSAGGALLRAAGRTG